MKHIFIISILFSALAVLPDRAYAQQLPANAVASSYMEQAANHIEWRTDHIEQAELCCMKQADCHGVQDVEAAVTGGALMRNRRGDMVDSKAWRQHRALKATAWTSLGLGIASLAGGVLWTVIDYDSNGRLKNANAESALVAAGAALTVGSIPLFCIAHHKRTRAYRLSMQVSEAPVNTVDGGQRNSHCVGLCLNF